MVRKLKNVEKETQTMNDLEYGEKHRKKQKNEKRTLQDLAIARKLNNVEKEKYTLQDLEFGEKPEKKVKK